MSCFVGFRAHSILGFPLYIYYSLGGDPRIIFRLCDIQRIKPRFSF
ncbi:MAG: hypothetical protein GX633_07285 [Clostridiales bacterium]|nr:hypothetical protein [Clostridiales bacterium]